MEKKFRVVRAQLLQDNKVVKTSNIEIDTDDIEEVRKEFHENLFTPDYKVNLTYITFNE